MAEKTFTINEGVYLADEVVSIIAGLAAADVEGVSSLGGGLTSDQIPKVGASKLSKGVRLIPGEDESLAVRLSLNIAYGFEIPKVCESVQEKVKNTIESMTGIAVSNVDIRIASVAVS